MSTVKLNFVGATREGLAVIGDVVRNARGEVLLAYLGNLGQISNQRGSSTHQERGDMLSSSKVLTRGSPLRHFNR